MTKQIAIYARVSSDQQAEAGTIKSQVAALLERVRSDQLKLPKDLMFLDDGYSGATLVRRRRWRSCAMLRTMARLTESTFNHQIVCPGSTRIKFFFWTSFAAQASRSSF